MSKTQVVYEAHVRVENAPGVSLSDTEAISEAQRAVGREGRDAFVETVVSDNVKIVAITLDGAG